MSSKTKAKTKKTPSGSKNGTAKVKGKGPKMSNGSATESKKDDGIVEDENYGRAEAAVTDAPAGVREAVGKLKEHAANGDKSALDAVEEIVVNFNGWREAKSNQKTVNKRCKEQVEQEEAAFKNAVEDPLPAGKINSHAIEKLGRVEERWQELQHVKAAVIEQKKEAKDSVKTWAGKLERSVSDSAQLAIPGVD